MKRLISFLFITVFALLVMQYVNSRQLDNHMNSIAASLPVHEVSESVKPANADENPVQETVNARIETNKGMMRVELYTKAAPVTTQNFIRLAQSGFYNGLVFHRVEPGFVIQTGDPTGTGSGGSDKKIPLEVTEQLKHDGPGVLAMARTSDPNSASSQFYITLDEASFLDGQYAVFGRVIEGLDVAGKIKRGDKLMKLTIEN